MLTCRLVVHWQVHRRERKLQQLEAKIAQAKDMISETLNAHSETVEDKKNN